MGDRIAILDVGGVLEQYATPAEILGRPASTMVRDFVGRRPRAEAAAGHAHRRRVPRAPADGVARRDAGRRPRRDREVGRGLGRGGRRRRRAARLRRRRARGRRRRGRRPPAAHRDLGAASTTTSRTRSPRCCSRARAGCRCSTATASSACSPPRRCTARCAVRWNSPADEGDDGLDDERVAWLDGRGRLAARPGGQHPAGAARAGRARPRVRSPRQGRAVQPRRQREGPSRGRDDRRRRARRPAQARRHHRRTDVGQHRRRPRHRRRAARLPLHLRDVRQDERGEGLAAARVRRRRGRVPDRGAARGPRLVLLGRRPPHAGDAGRVPARPVLQPGQPGRARALDRTRDLAPDRRAGSRTSSPASAPAAPSPVSPGTSRRRTPRCRSSPPIPRARCTRAAPAVRTSSRAWARTSGRPPTTRRSSTAR